MSEVSTNETKRAANPYQAPFAESGTGFSHREPTLPVSPVWALLISLSPLLVAFGAAVVFARDEWLFLCASYAFVFLSLDAAAFVSRTLWIGPGGLRLRVATVALVTVTIALSLSALVHLAGRELESFTPVRFAVQHMLVTCACIALAAIPFACGSRDRLRSGARKLPLRYDVAAVVFAAVVAALATTAALAERQLYSSERFAEYAREFDPTNFRPVITVVATFLMTMVWRSLFRGTWPWRSWKMLGLSAVASLWTLLGIALSVVAWLTGGGGLGLVFGLSLVVVPAGRELFLRAAGYRTVNVYAERRRRRKKASAATNGSV